MKCQIWIKPVVYNDLFRVTTPHELIVRQIAETFKQMEQWQCLDQAYNGKIYSGVVHMTIAMW